MKNERIQRDSGPNGGEGLRGQRSSARARQIGLLGWALTALTCCLSLGVAGASGCGDTIDSKGLSETGGQGEALGEARQADSAPITCVTLQRGLTKATDAMISSEKAANNYGTGTVALVGQASGSGVDHFYSLFRFDTSPIPVNAVITSATIALAQVTPAPGSWNAHLITAPWDELTVTWSSFNNAFNPTTFKSASTATPPNEGGAIAHGHPIGATGAILTTRLLHAMPQRPERSCWRCSWTLPSAVRTRGCWTASARASPS